MSQSTMLGQAMGGEPGGSGFAGRSAFRTLLGGQRGVPGGQPGTPGRPGDGGSRMIPH